MKKIKLNETTLHMIVSEAISKVLYESFEGNYYIKYLDDNSTESISPIYVLGANDYDPEEGEVIINGKPMFYASENTNFYADPANSTPREGDLVFDVNGEICLYRKGLNVPTSESFYNNAIIGTASEIKSNV